MSTVVRTVFGTVVATVARSCHVTLNVLVTVDVIKLVLTLVTVTVLVGGSGGVGSSFPLFFGAGAACGLPPSGKATFGGGMSERF